MGNVDGFQEYLVQEYLNVSIRTSVEKNIYNDNTNVENLTLINIVDIIGKIVESTVSENNYDGYAELIRNYLVSEYRGAQIFSCSSAYLDTQCDPFKIRIYDLLISFREVYADICRLFCLKLSPFEYLDVALHQGE